MPVEWSVSRDENLLLAVETEFAAFDALRLRTAPLRPPEVRTTTSPDVAVMTSAQVDTVVLIVEVVL